MPALVDDPAPGVLLEAAGTGAWRCDLADDALTWTGGVYALFGIGADARIDRRDTVALYARESRIAMERSRAVAIATERTGGGGFTLDARIVRADGAARWMRLSAGVARHGGRRVLHGTKRDITVARAGIVAAMPPGMDGVAAMVVVSVDGLDAIAERFGAGARAACLDAVAARLRAGFVHAVRIVAVAPARFAVVFAADAPLAHVERVVAAGGGALSLPVAWRGRSLFVRVTMGVAAAAVPGACPAGAVYAAAVGALERSGCVRAGWAVGLG